MTDQVSTSGCDSGVGVCEGAPRQVVVVEVSEEELELTISGEQPVVVEVPEPETEVIEVMIPGVQGPPGDSAEALQTYTAGEDVSGERAVYLDEDGELRYANSSDLAQAYLVAGITTQASLAGGTVKVRTGGVMESNSWSWVPELPVFLGTNGTITQTAPTSGALLVLGVAVSTTVLLVRIGRPIWRS